MFCARVRVRVRVSVRVRARVMNKKMPNMFIVFSSFTYAAVCFKTCVRM